MTPQIFAWHPVVDGVDTEPMATLFEPHLFVDDRTFLTKHHDLGVAYRLTGIDAEGLDSSEQRAAIHALETALRVLDPQIRSYQYLIKRAAPPLYGHALYTIDLYTVLMAEGRLGTRLTVPAVTAAAEYLRWQAGAYMDQIAAARPVALTADETLAFLRRLATPRPAPRVLHAHRPLDEQIADASLRCYYDHLMIGPDRVRILTMATAPDATTPGILASLYGLQGDVLACWEWKRWTDLAATRHIAGRTKYFFTKRVRVTATSLRRHDGPQLENAGAINAVARCGQADIDSMNGHALGECSLTLVCTGQHADQCAADAQAALAAVGGHFLPETIAQLAAWRAIFPGGARFNMRREPYFDINAAELGFLFNVDQGVERDAAGRPPIATWITKPHGTPYWLHLHVADVGHAALFGRTGTGKTVALRVLADGAAQYDRRRIVIFDQADGFRALASAHGGSVCDFSTTPLNPFALPLDQDQTEFLARWCSLLIEHDGYAMTEPDRKQLYAGIACLRKYQPRDRRLGTLIDLGLTATVRTRLEPWVQGGRWGSLFDHATDALTLDDVQVFECGAFTRHPHLLDPLLMYVLRRVERALTRDISTFCFLDEAWQFAAQETMRTFILTALKTWRKANGLIVLATQSVEDFTGSPIFLRAVLDACHTTLFLANPDFDRSLYAAGSPERTRYFTFNEKELALMASVHPRGEVFLRRTGADRVAHVLRLVPDPQRPYLLEAGTTLPREVLYA